MRTCRFTLLESSRLRGFLAAVLLTLCAQLSHGQSYIFEGYTYETGNRGYLSQVAVDVIDTETGQVIFTTQSNVEGYFSFDVPPIPSCVLKFHKEMFKTIEKEVHPKPGKSFLKIEMERSPGYLLEITLADKRESPEDVVDAVTGTLIEVYNNTTEELVMISKDHPSPEVKINLHNDNHYTILIRKKGYIAKKLEAYLNVNGCIFCFEGISKLTPGVKEVLTAGNRYGAVLANVEMESVFKGKSFEVNNIFYNLNSAVLKPESKKELDKVINLMKYNPNLTVELGSHTDSRASDEYNMELSNRRAIAAVSYIKSKGSIPSFRIISKGYGETQLKNECFDGVECPEELHQQNRRTEIKILGISEEWIFKPLAQIKSEIKFEEELYRSIYSNSRQGAEITYKQLRRIEDQAMMPISKSRIVGYAEGGSPIPDSSDYFSALLNEEFDIPEDAISDELPDPNRVSDGYKIIIHYDAVPILQDHELWRRNENLEVYVSPEDFFYYMIPGFTSAEEAENVLNRDYINVYPQAYIAGFKNGRRIH